jgi:hypothetical protein
LKRVLPDHARQRVNRCVIKRTTDPRLRWSTKQPLLCRLVMGRSIQGQLTERFREGFELLSGMFYRRRRCGGTCQGSTQATRRVGMAASTDFWRCPRQTIPNRVGAARTWFGWTVLAVDGSRVDAPRTKRSEGPLGKAGRDKTHPHWRITRLIRCGGNTTLPAAVRDEYVGRSSKRAGDRPHQKKEQPSGCPRPRRLKASEKARIHAVLTGHAAQLT